MPIPHIIFDLDGTLIDSSASILTSFKHAFASMQLEPKRALTPDVIGPPLMQTLATLAGTEDAALLKALALAFKAHYDSEGYQQTVVFAGVDDMLTTLAAAGAQLYIATNKRLHPTRKILQHLDWQRYFREVYALDYFTPPLVSKQLMVAQVLAKEGLADEALALASAVYIGDRYEDGMAAQNNGLAFGLVTWGYLDESMGGIPVHWPQYATPQALTEYLIK